MLQIRAADNTVVDLIPTDAPVSSIVDLTTGVYATTIRPDDVTSSLIRVDAPDAAQAIVVSTGPGSTSVLGMSDVLAVRSDEGAMAFLHPTRGDGDRWTDSFVAAPPFGPAGYVPPASGTLMAWDGTRVWNLIETAAGTPQLVAIDPGPIVTSDGGGRPLMVASIDTAGGRGRVVAAFGKIWLAGTTDNTLTAVDPGTRQVVSTFEGMPGPYLTASEDSLYVCGQRGVVRLDPASGGTLATSAQSCFVDLTVGDGSVWVAGGGGVVRLDADTLEEQATIPDVTAQWGLTYAFGSLWVADGSGHSGPDGLSGFVTRVDPTSKHRGRRDPDPRPSEADDSHRRWVVADDRDEPRR